MKDTFFLKGTISPRNALSIKVTFTRTDNCLNGFLIIHRFQDIVEVDGKRPFAALPSPLVTAAYSYVRLIQHLICIESIELQAHAHSKNDKKKHHPFSEA
jgi:hypothetical protein